MTTQHIPNGRQNSWQGRTSIIRTLFILLFALYLSSSIWAQSVHADTIYESAKLIPTSSTLGLDVSASQYLGVRFQLTAPRHIDSIGAHMVGDDTYFGAIVQLSSSTDFPDSLDLSTPDVLARVNIKSTKTASETSGLLSLDLAPGNYALVFGKSSRDGNLVCAPATDSDISSPSYFFRGNGFYKDGGFNNARMFVTGHPQVDFEVNSTADTDDGSCSTSDCTLREAINGANTDPGLSHITFSPTVFDTRKTITLTNNALPGITGDTTITAPSAGVVLDANGNGFSIEAFSGDLTLDGLTCKGGTSSNTYNIFYGGQGQLTVQNCTVSGSGFGISSPDRKSHLTLTNSTITECGYGVFADTDGTALISNCTFANNTISVLNVGTIPLVLSNCLIVKDNTSDRVNDDHTLRFATYSAAGLDTTLKDNGGRTPTFALLPFSPALDTGNSNLTTDQRGLPRPSGGTDIGAFELQNQPPTIGAISVSTDEDTAYSFAVSDFTGAYSDPEGDALGRIKIVSLPTNGTLLLSGESIGADTIIPANQIANLKYAPLADFNGTDSFGFKGADNFSYATSVSTVTITVKPTNDAPAITADKTGVSLVAGTSTTVTLFPRDSDSSAIARIKTQPTIGTASVTYSNGQWKLTYRAPAGTPVNTRVIVEAYDGTLVSPPLSIRFTSVVNYAPIAVSLSPNISTVQTGAGNNIGTINGTELVVTQKVRDPNGPTDLNKIFLLLDATSSLASGQPRQIGIQLNAVNRTYAVVNGASLSPIVTQNNNTRLGAVQALILGGEIITAQDGTLSIKWRFHFAQPAVGTYRLSTRVIDAAGATTTQSFGQINIVAPSAAISRTPSGTPSGSSASDS